jgi:predicted GNAT superfamily acetyltransferase
MSGARARVEPTAGGEAEADGVILRRVDTQEEYDECVRIQDETWGAGFNERVPSTILRVSQFLGGVTAAAFDDKHDRMLGFVFGMTGLQDGRLVHWSDLLAVRPESRGRGLGRRLKLFQRSLVLPLGVTRMAWTFDPLVARNAYFNLHKLGAVIDRFERDFYGEMADDLNRGDRSDRFVVRWDVHRPPGPLSVQVSGDPVVVRRAADGSPEHGGHAIGDAAIVEVPPDHAELRATDERVASAWRDAVADAAEACLAHGLLGAAFDRDRSAYVFARSFGRWMAA